MPRSPCARVKGEADQRPQRNRHDQSRDDDRNHGVVPGEDEQIEGNVLAEYGVDGPGAGRAEEAQRRHPKGRSAKPYQSSEKRCCEPRSGRWDRRQWSA
jgi:hypothetical protein